MLQIRGKKSPPSKVKRNILVIFHIEILTYSCQSFTTVRHSMHVLKRNFCFSSIFHSCMNSNFFVFMASCQKSQHVYPCHHTVIRIASQWDHLSSLNLLVTTLLRSTRTHATLFPTHLSVVDDAKSNLWYFCCVMILFNREKAANQFGRSC